MPADERSAGRLAYKRAYKKKRRAEGKTKTVAVEFYLHDMALYEHAKAQGNITQYIKGLIRSDMEASA